MIVPFLNILSVGLFLIVLLTVWVNIFKEEVVSNRLVGFFILTDYIVKTFIWMLSEGIAVLDILSIVFSFSMLVFIGLSLYCPTGSVVLSEKSKISYVDLIVVFLMLDYVVKTIVWVIA